MKRETNANLKMQLLWECHNHKRIIRIPTLPIQKEVLCTMPTMQTHKQLPHPLMASTRYNRPNRERIKQKQEMVKYDRSQKSITQRPGRASPQRIRVATPKTQPNHGHDPKNPRQLLERTTRSRENIETSSTGTQNKPRLPEQNPEQKRHLLERTIK